MMISLTSFLMPRMPKFKCSFAIMRTLYFCPVVSIFLLLFSSPNLGRRRLDVYHTSTRDVAFARI